MSSDRFQKVGELFDAVVDLPEAERAAQLRAMCADPQLIVEVEALLAADRRADDFGRAAALLRDAAALAVDSGADPIEQRFGAWRVARELGRGGMGEVLLVERDSGGFEQRGALKRIRRGLDSEVALARFLRERQLLARLDHPHIARLLDGGMGDDGQPWFVMEFVDGEPLLRWCAANAPSVAGRLQQFVHICAAVSFAHRQLIVHRDIKPSNLLVARDGQVKLLDFGIAKLIEANADSDAASAASETRDGPLTPQYAAPEQLRGRPVTTVTDVYGLGTVLYELLCGQRPYAIDSERSAADWLQVLEGPECPPPSRVAAGPAASLPPIDPRVLRGDLDTIALTALRRAPERRYASVDALREDIERYLRGLPIAARPDRLSYRAGKFIGRHRLLVIAASLAAAALLAAATITLAAQRTALREAQRAAAVQGFMTELFDASDPELVAGGYRMAAREVVDSGVRQLPTRFAQDPALRAELSLLLGRIQWRLGDTRSAIALLSWEDSQADPIDGRMRRDPARWAQLSEAFATQGDAQAADAQARRLEQHARDLADARLLATALRLRSEAARASGDRARSTTLAQDSVRAAEASNDPLVLAESLLVLAALLRETDRTTQARASAERGIALLDRTAQRDALLAATARIELAGALQRSGDLDAAEAHINEAQAIIERRLPPLHPTRADALSLRAGIAGDRGQFAAAVGYERAAVGILEQALGPSVLLGGHLSGLAMAQRNSGDRHAALASGERAVAVFRALGQPDHPYAINALGNMANLMDELGDASAAEATARSALDASRRVLGPRAGGTTSRMMALARILRRHGRAADALVVARAALAIQDALPELGRVVRITGLQVTALAEADDGHPDTATALFERALALCRSPPEVDRVGLGDVQANYAEVLGRMGRFDEAERMARESLAAGDALYAEGRSWRTGLRRVVLGEILARQPARRAEARVLLEQALHQLATSDGDDGPHTARARAALQRL